MPNIITGIQIELIKLFKAAKVAEPQNAPKVIRAYNGELKDPKGLVRNMPALFVDVTSDFVLQADDFNGELHSGNYAPEIILFDKNNLNKEKTYGEMAVLIDWVVEALRGEQIIVDGQPIPVATEIRGKYMGDIVPAAVLTLNLGSLEGDYA